MGGDTASPLLYSTEESSLDENFPKNSVGLPTFLSGGDHFSSKAENEETELLRTNFKEFVLASSNSLDEVNQRRVRNVYMDVLMSYDELLFRKEHLKEAKSKILSYTPASWTEEVGGMKLSDYNIPKKMTLLFIGPKGSGKSSLVNKISRVLEDDPFAPERAQVSYSSVGDGTYFLQEYTIPRGSGSFCLYDTRSLSDDMAENMKLVTRWMTKGVRHGELITRDSDDVDLKSKMKSKARQNNYCDIEAKAVNFVVLVVSAVSILELIGSDDETKRRQTQVLAATFNHPFLSFKDDKPVVVLTHGDLLSLSDRARIRMYLGQLLGVHPKKQIFDIPENDDSAELTIVDMLRHCLERADKNLPVKEDRPFKGHFTSKVRSPLEELAILGPSLLAYAVLVILFGMWMIFTNTLHGQAPQSHVNVDWNATSVNSVPNLQPEPSQPPHVNIDCPASEVDFAPDLDPEVSQSHVNIDKDVSEVEYAPEQHPEASQSDGNIVWGAIRHLWLDTD